MLRSKLIEARGHSGAPGFLPRAYQSLMTSKLDLRTQRAKRKDFMADPIRQIVGTTPEETSRRHVIYDMMNECIEATKRMNRLVQTG
jgi:hypothetical protein